MNSQLPGEGHANREAVRQCASQLEERVNAARDSLAGLLAEIAGKNRQAHRNEIIELSGALDVLTRIAIEFQAPILGRARRIGELLDSLPKPGNPVTESGEEQRRMKVDSVNTEEEENMWSEFQVLDDYIDSLRQRWSAVRAALP